jgi:hypothetical protein
MKKQTEYEELYSTSTGFGQQLATDLNPSFEDDDPTAISYFWVWSLGSVIPLYACSDVGAIGTFIIGVVLCAVGSLWAGLFAGAGQFIREAPSVMGVTTVVSAFISIIIPIPYLFLIAAIASPMALQKMLDNG